MNLAILGPVTPPNVFSPTLASKSGAVTPSDPSGFIFSAVLVREALWPGRSGDDFGVIIANIWGVGGVLAP